ncbi:unnamed protein product [Notodromas monacha]|uniref:Uncharacterized protein n=1 Tax=Notodromas monacha TaxID=399045 RepID=A0A7R9BR56_9CRUS|nr:unnamed protein product [Notodromas monacha]CAG0920161.1 unnamed protein product [Notodromas monacha]
MGGGRLLETVVAVLGMCSGRTWCALAVVSVTGGAWILSLYQERQEELVQRIVYRDRDPDRVSGPISARVARVPLFQPVPWPKGLFILDGGRQQERHDVCSVSGLPRFRCPFPRNRDMTFANALLLALAHNPVLRHYIVAMLASAQRVWQQVWEAPVPVRQSLTALSDFSSTSCSIPSPSRESLRAMKAGIDVTPLLASVRMRAGRRRHADRHVDSVDDFLWLLLTNLAEDLQCGAEFSEAVLGSQRVSLWCLECGKLALVDTDSVSVPLDGLLVEDGVASGLRRGLVRRAARRDKGLQAAFFRPDEPCRHSSFRCMATATASKSSSSSHNSTAIGRPAMLVVSVPDADFVSFPLRHGLAPGYDLQCALYASSVEDGGQRTVESFSCAFRNGLDARWYFFDGHDNYYSLPDAGSPLSSSPSSAALKDALHFTPPVMLIYVARNWARTVVAKADINHNAQCLSPTSSGVVSRLTSCLSAAFRCLLT